MRRIALGVALTLLATTASGCLFGVPEAGTPGRPRAYPGQPGRRQHRARPRPRPPHSDPNASGEESSGSRIGFRNKKVVSDAVMFGNQPESSYRDTPVP